MPLRPKNVGLENRPSKGMLIIKTVLYGLLASDIHCDPYTNTRQAKIDACGGDGSPIFAVTVHTSNSEYVNVSRARDRARR
jgi:hypothetical protein